MVTNELHKATQAVYSRAERDRDIRDVDPSHWHWKAYQGWLRAKRPQYTPQLNFCHYWRVVLLFAFPRITWERRIAPWLVPLWRRIPFKDVLVVIIVIVLVAMFVSALISSRGFRIFVLVAVLVVPYCVGAFLTARYWWLKSEHYFQRTSFNFDRMPRWLSVVIHLVFGIPAFVGLGVFLALSRVFDRIVWLVEDFDAEEHIGKRLKSALKFVVRALDAHPPRRPRFRAWTVMLGTSVTFLGADGAAHGTILSAGVATAMWIACIIGALFAIGHMLAAGYRLLVRKDQEERASLFAIVGFRKWLWESELRVPQEFRMDFGDRLNSSSTAAEHAAVVPWERLDRLIESFVSRGELRPMQVRVIPRRMLPAHLRPPQPPKKVRLRRTRHFLAGTWAFIRLLWAGLVYIKRVGACPLIRVKSDQPATNDAVTP